MLFRDIMLIFFFQCKQRTNKMNVENMHTVKPFCHVNRKSVRPLLEM